MIPVHIPALKMPPMAEQLLKLAVNTNNTAAMDSEKRFIF